MNLIVSNPTVPRLTSNVERLLSDAASKIRRAVGRQLEHVIIVGTALNEVKQALPHGEFGKWINAEFGWSDRTAQNYMLAAETYGANPQRVSYLPIKTLFRLQAPSVPAVVRDDVYRLLDQGAQVTETKVAEMIAGALQMQKMAAAEARLSSSQRRSRRRREKEIAEHRAQREGEEIAEKQAAEKAASLVLASMPDRVDDLIALLDGAPSWRFVAALMAMREADR